MPTLPDISDHANVILHFSDEPRPRKTPTPYFNKGLLANTKNLAQLLTTWKDTIKDDSYPTWNLKMVAANTTIRLKSMELTKQQRKKWREVYQAQFANIQEVEAELPRNWGSREARNKLSDAQAAIHEVRQQKF